MSAEEEVQGPSPLSNDTRKSVFIMLPGHFTGDMWHCAAASVLTWQEDRKVIRPYPVIVIGVTEYNYEKGTKTVVKDNSFVRGGPMFDYFKSIGIPCLLARINVRNRNQVQGAMNSLERDYLQRMINVYKEAPAGTFRQIWNKTEPAAVFNPREALPDAPNIPKPTDASMFGAPAAESDIEEPDYIWNPPENFKSGQRLQLMTSTTIVMQYLAPPDTRKTRVDTLRKYLGPITPAAAEWVTMARAKKEELKKLITEKFGWKDGDGQNIILFNYRVGDVNKQHDASPALLTHVRDLVKDDRGVAKYQVVPIVVGVNDVDAKTIDSLKTPGYLNLYPEKVFVDKRMTAAFWQLVAEELKVQIKGLIGGRSGSMDIAAFMGMNTCSWDEKLLPWTRPEAYKRNDGAAALIGQQTQYLRLYNQYPIMSIVHLDSESYDAVATRAAGSNVYTRLDKDQMLAWINLKREVIKDPTTKPPLDPASATEPVKTAFKKMEEPGLGIKAVNIRNFKTPAGTQPFANL